ncbi:FAD-dependent oxidoreductase [Sphingomonas desiccabilis]|uniref:FAD-dependent monooxygenase n=1 Tax=Sphingomonas desiccabilis TaxID=429134 RepID=A0A4Q2IU76_9SPHN|nr:NAD(P)/FAD-dependent oxidoreductase [Sphingomonas desiccabilis]MBB3909432.1 2-polyprenyl-6-methoxyphenol hydroxylase-like FAD-dependent oxidoreductase [Sphingomonas desiccabilis]RXZ34179.1 FAD-dependent monooxygenase [Sphingomonas desiccabilis]
MTARTIAIAGCGPAGLAAALLLARDGHRVTLLERFATPQPIGSGLMLQPTGLAVLRELGLTEEVLARGARVDRLLGCTAEGRVVLDVAYRALKGERFGLGIHRASLFGVLFDAAVAAGIPIETGRTVTGSEPAGDGRRRLLFEGGTRSAKFDLVVDALGSRTPLAPPTGRELAYGALWTSLAWPEGTSLSLSTLEQRYDRASRMVGVLPTGTRAGGGGAEASLFWSLRLDRLEAWRTAGLAAWKAEVRALWPATEPLLAQIDHPDQLAVARYAHRTLSKPAATGLIHIGDTWHSASPQLGQGANMALLDAWALRQGLRGAATVEAGLVRTVAMRQRHVALYQALTALLTPVYQSDSRVIPALRDRLVAPLSRLPLVEGIQAALVAGLVGRPLAKLALHA